MDELLNNGLEKTVLVVMLRKHLPVDVTVTANLTVTVNVKWRTEDPKPTTAVNFLHDRLSFFLC